MTQYEENIKTLNQKYSGMGDRFIKALSASSENIRIWDENIAENKVIKVSADERELYLSGKRNSREPVEAWINNLGKLFANAPILIEGVGNPDYLTALIDYAEEKIVILVYEPSLRMFEYFLKSVDLKELMDRQNIIFWVDGIDGMDEDRLGIVVKNLIRYENLNMSRFLIVPNYDVLFPEQTLAFARICRNQSQDEAVSRNTRRKFSTVMPKNLLSNLRYLVDGYKTVQYAGKIPAGVPGILVAAGPSLNKNIKELKKAKGKAFIIATDTAIKPLMKEGIIPDMFAIVDGKKPLELVQIEQVRNIPLLTTIVAASEVLEYHTGKKIFCNEQIQLSEEIMNHSHFPHSPMAIGGSVATHAFTFMYMIGIKTIILIGQDLAFTNNRSHADGTFEDKMPEVDTSKFIMVDGNYEEKVPTSSDFKLYLEWYEKYIAGFQSENPDFRVINATEGGAKIKGTEISTLREAIQKECTTEVDIEKIIASITSMHDEEERKWSIEYINDIPFKCQRLLKDASEAKKQYQKLSKLCRRTDIDSREYKSIIKKLDRILERIEQQAVYDLVRDTLSDAQYILKNEAYLEYGTVQEEGTEIARKGILYMESVQECARVFYEYFEDACDKKNREYFESIN